MVHHVQEDLGRQLLTNHIKSTQSNDREEWQNYHFQAISYSSKIAAI